MPAFPSSRYSPKTSAKHVWLAPKLRANKEFFHLIAASWALGEEQVENDRMGARTDPAAVLVDGILDRLAYRCFPDGCPSGRSCCVGAAVELSSAEMSRIDSIMPELARERPTLRDSQGLVDVFAPDDGCITIEPVDERGTCPFLFRQRARALCSIHDWALRTDREVASVKPRACRLWPLTLEIRKGRRVITVVPQALEIGCIAPIAELPGQPTVREAFASEIQDLLNT